jgi:hypothetical protein
LEGSLQRISYVAVEPIRNLLIVHTPLSQELSDWLTVKQKIGAKAPDIEVRIISNVLPDARTQQWQTTRPSLVFSPVNFVRFKPAGGKVYVGRQLDKLIEASRLRRGGLPVPMTERLVPGHKLDRAVWGDYVVIKPSNEGGSRGRSVRLVRTQMLSALSGKRQPQRMIVQQFLDATDEAGRLCEYRILTLFGRPIYSQLGAMVDARPPLSEIADTLKGEFAYNRSGVKREWKAVKEPEVLDLAIRASATLSEFPCLGVDIVRDRATGRLYILETNTGGNTWHLSSASGLKFPADFRRQLYAQFDALETAADVLIAKTRAEAA